MSTGFIVLLVLASFASSGVFIFAMRYAAKSREALKNYAAQSGWQYEYAARSNGSDTTISDPAEGWYLRMQHRNSRAGSGSSGNSTHAVRFEVPDLGCPGMAVLGPDIPEKTKQMADKMMGLMGGDIGRFVLDKLTGGLGDEAQGLRTIDGPGPGTLMAAPGAETALDDLRYAPELNNARAGKNEAQQPIVIRDPSGLRIQIRRRVRTPKDAAEIISLGRALADNLRG